MDRSPKPPESVIAKKEQKEYIYAIKAEINGKAGRMANAGTRRAGATQFKPGQSGNPAGRPRGAKAKLTEEFLKALLEDFARNGKEAIRKARDRSPVQYLRLIATLVPKNWFGEDDEDEQVPVPVIVVKPKHEMVRSPHALR